MPYKKTVKSVPSVRPNSFCAICDICVTFKENQTGSLFLRFQRFLRDF